MNNPEKELKLSVALSYLILFTNVVTSIVITPFIIKNLGTSEYGLYMLVFSIGMYFNIEGLGIGGVIVRNVKKYLMLNEKKELESFLFLSFLIFIALAFLTLLVCIGINCSAGTLFKNSIDSKDISRFRIMFELTTMNCILMFALNFLTSIITGYKKFLFIRIITLSKIIFRLLFIILTISIIQIETLIILDLGITIVAIFLSSYYMFIKLGVRIKMHFFNKSLFILTLKRTGFLFVSLVTDNICWSSGSLIIAMTLGTPYVGLFSMAMTFCGIFSQLSTTISSLFLPGITELVVKKTSKNKLLDKMIDAGRYLLVLLTLVIFGFAFIGIEFLNAYLGNEFDMTYYIALPLMIVLLLPSIQFVGDNIMQAYNKFNTRSTIYMISAVVSVALSFYLTPMLGIQYSWVGLAISTVIFRIFIINFYYCRLGLNMFTFFKRTVFPMIFTGIIIVPVLMLCFSVVKIHFIIKGCMVVIIYFIFIWFTYLNKKERLSILNIVNKRLALERK